MSSPPEPAAAILPEGPSTTHINGNGIAHPDPDHPHSPPRTDSIDISIYRRRRKHSHSRSRSRSTIFRGGTIGTMTTTHTIYHTPTSSIFDTFESARSSPQPRSSHFPSNAPSPAPSRSPSHSPVRSPRRKLSMASMSSDAQTITPSLFVRGKNLNTDSTSHTSPLPSPAHSLPVPPPLEHGPRLFFTSAKTGDGVADVFEYVARRVVERFEHDEAIDARTLHVAEGSVDGSSTIRLRGPQYDRYPWKDSCCGS